MENIENLLNRLRHSCSHVLADAVKKLYPKVKLGIGPAIKDGFYYDFDFSECDNKNVEYFLKPDDLEKIEQQMQQIIDQDLSFISERVSIQKAKDFFNENGEIYKVDLLDNIEAKEVFFYKHGDFIDLCKGPHIEKTSQIKAFKLLSLAGAYWKGDENNKMLQRIYGTAFYSRKDLKKYLNFLEEAQKRDHRKIGKQMQFFSFNDQVGAGLVLYHPKGAIIRHIISDYITKEHLKRDYELISSPHILKSDIWIKSGHYEYYKDNMYILEKDKQEYAVKPMNCPGHILVYLSKIRSYRDFPIRYFELGNVYRHEKTGVLHGLLRVRGFTQDDAHIFCLKEQLQEEIINIVDFVKDVLSVFGFKRFEVELSTRPEKYIGSEEDWDIATKTLEKALQKKEIKYDINKGDGAFYGPKIDMKLKDALGRSWQCATIQCDFALPKRFDLKYIDSNGQKQYPVVLHRVILGSLERFFGTLIEHYKGAFPLWLAPVQVEIIPISDTFLDYVKHIKEELLNIGYRVEIDSRIEKMQKKIRDAEVLQIPYMVIIGEKEKEKNTLSIRSKKQGNLGEFSLEDFIEHLKKEMNF